MSINKHIPNSITCLNLLCGCLSVYYVFNDNIILASILIFIAGVFDFFDGFLARLLNVKSSIGKELDSLADLVSFGLAPGFIILYLIGMGIKSQPDIFNIPENIKFIGLLIPIFSAIRLAKFNIDSRQSESFIGVPTPANALFIASLPIIAYAKWGSPVDFYFKEFFIPLLINPYILILYVIVMSYLLVSEINLFALKFKTFDYKQNKIRYIFLGLTIILISIFYFAAIPIVIILYIILSVINNLKKENK